MTSLTHDVGPTQRRDEESEALLLRSSAEKQCEIEASVENNCYKNHRRVAYVVNLLLLVAIAVFALGTTNPSLLDQQHGDEKESGEAPHDNPLAIKQTQIANYRKNESLMLNVHITHHAGTTFCHRIGQLGPTPSLACMEDDNWPKNIRRGTKPWTYNETGFMVTSLRHYFHMISWEYSVFNQPRPPLSGTNWEHPKLLSVIIMRHPMDRLLARNGPGFKRIYGSESERTGDQWWRYANTDRTNNYALTVLAGNGCCHGEATNATHLETAKKLVQRFTYVLDQACLDESLDVLASELGLKLEPVKEKNLGKHPPARERIGNDTLYEFLVRRNHVDIALYEWSKTISLVNCSDLLEEEQRDELL